MRKDLTVELLVEREVKKLNKTELARVYGCCWETIDRRLNPDKYNKNKKERIYTSKLEPFKKLIDEKLEEANIPATGLLFLLKEKYGYEGGYGILRKYISTKKEDIISKLTIRFETIKGYQSQVDWKENLKLYDKDGNEYIINIFLIVLGYSRMKYIELTFDKTQPTLFKCLSNAFEYFGGTTEEILFDNMKTIVDHIHSSYSELIINTKALQFAKDANFKIRTCKAYRPRTKGKVETLAKIMNRLKAFNHEFNNKEELNNVVKKLNYNLNYIEKSQAIDEIPANKFINEKEYLFRVNLSILKQYYVPSKTYKVSNESMINYQGVKYSVPIKYIDKYLSVLDDDTFINIYYNTDLVTSYNKSTSKKFNYKSDDYFNILKNSAFKDKNEDDIQKYIKNNLQNMDSINIEKEKNHD
ncbi:MAG: IS21 family transposase [Clostridia bacterium]